MKKTKFLIALTAAGALLLTGCRKEGCTDENAKNFDSKTKKDSGACEYVEGCTDASAKNYNSDAKKDNGSCIYETIADDNTFKDFASWTLVTTRTGADPALGGMAHGGNDSTVTRKIYIKENVSLTNGQYPRGTVVVKQSTKPDGSMNEITAMVKRGGGFDSEHNDWEYFMLMPDGKIADGGKMRGSALMEGMCRMCHKSASNKDYIFTK